MHRTRAFAFAIIAVLLASLGAPPVTSAAAPDARPGPDRSLVQRLGPARISYHAGTGYVRFVAGTSSAPIRAASGPTDPAAAARAFLGAYGTLFGLTVPNEELRARPVGEPVGGLSVVRLDQVYKGVPVIAGELAAQVDASGAVLAVSGEISPKLSLDVTPVITAQQAAAAAMTATAKANDTAASGLSAAPPTLAIHDPALLGGPGIAWPRLVWRTEVRTADGAVRDFVAVDAVTGGIALRFSQVETALDRRICDHANVPSDTPCTGSYARVEGGPATGIAEADAAYDYLGDAYNFYLSQVGRDSIDGAGMPIVLTVRYCPSDGCPYDNAHWNGTQMEFGQGFVIDDIVGHELTHGVTDYTSGLYYYYQSGAINEAMSDVFGEFIDQTNGRGNDSPAVRWLIGEDLSFGPGRNMANPPAYDQPDRMQNSVYYSGADDQGGVHTNSGIANKAAYLLTDGGTFNGHVVGAIGLAKTARVFYVANSTLLTSGSDYADLYDALQQACTASIGTGGITSGDCAQVAQAVAATEMDLQPITGAAVPDAPVCSAGTTPVDLFFAGFEGGAPGWSTANPVGSNAWTYTTGYAKTGSQSLWGQDLGSTSLSQVMMDAGVALPAGASYLRFDHAYQFEAGIISYYDGGVVEYTVDDGTTWVDAALLFVDGPYNGTISASYGNPLGGRSGFTNESYGYASSRLDLASLAGDTVRFRFGVGTDSSTGALGWLIDNVRIYTCSAAGVPGAPTDVTAVRGNASATVSWSAPADIGDSPISAYNVTAAPGGATCGTTGALSCEVPGLANGTPYTFTVRATNADGTGPASDPSAPVTPATVPGSPTSVVATRGNASALVSWIAPASTGGDPITGYTVTSVPDGRTCATTGALSCTVPLLTNGTPYTFTVTATNSVGTGLASSASAPVTPVSPPTASITALSLWVTSSSIAVRWGATKGTMPLTFWDVRYRRAPWNGTFGGYTTWRSGTASTSGTFTVSPGYTYCFSARVRDTVANLSAWTGETCTAVALDDRSLSRYGSWTAGTGSAYYRSTYLRSYTRYAKVVRTSVYARRIAIVATTCPTCGSISVYWGSTFLKTISLKSTTTVNKKLLVVTTFASARAGTLTIKVYTSGKKVILDGVVIRPN